MSKNFRDIFWEQIYAAAKKDRNIVIVSADLGAISLDRFREELPGQFVNTGIAEQNAITVAAGLALRGKRVFVYANAPFIHMRCYEQIRLTASGMMLPITIVGQGAGFSFWEYGPTHHTLEDYGSMRMLPNMKVYVASDPAVTEALATHTLHCNHASYIRMDKLALPSYPNSECIHVEQGFRTFGASTGKILLIGCGNMVRHVSEAAQVLKEQGQSCGWMDLFSLTPDNSKLAETISSVDAVITVEEHGKIGGIASLVNEVMSDFQIWKPMRKIACDTSHGYVYEYGSRETIQAHYGLTVSNIVKEALTLI